ncbi:MAG: FAD-dependent monooxygenase [Alphaproteobacteria bacterium]|nr:FAD-dependent monooxygenase [Alphaproteobacteria bacterium]
MQDVIVVGAGPAGLCTALALAERGVPNTLIAAPHRPAGDKPDTRTAALFNPSIQLLRNIGVWNAVVEHCAPLAAIRLIDDTAAIFRAPELTFHASEIAEAVFGFNVPQVRLLAALNAKAQDAAAVRIVESAGVRDFSIGEDLVTLHLAEGDSLDARLVIAADGRNSLARRAAGISVKESPCNQTAVACAFWHQRDHQSVSTEFHRRAGPMTVVPMPGRASSLVWVERPETAARLGAMDDKEFARNLQRNLQGLLGEIAQVGPRVLFPLSHMTAAAMGRNRIALIGEAAHAMPPIGAQGLNLSLRDAAVVAEIAGEALQAGNDPGSPFCLGAYQDARLPDAKERSFAVGSLNAALISGLIPVQLARGAGLHLINAVPPLRRRLMHLGLAPRGPLPPLMRRETL